MAVETNARIEFSVASVAEWEKVNPKLHQGEPVFAKKPSGKYILKVGAPGGSTYQNAVVVWDQDDAETKMTSTQEAAAQALASKNAASASASAAKASENAAAASKSAAATSAENAKTSETNAAASANTAKAWSMSDSSPDGVSGNKSAKTWAEEANTSASNSADSASASQSSATESASSATNAANSANASKQSASASANSATAAASSASDSATSASNAKISETNASNSASAAAQSAENAKTWDPTQYVTKAAANQLLRNTAYAVGDIAYSPNLPSYLYLECTTAGTTGATAPDMSTISGGVMVNDGTAKFSVKTVCAKEYVDSMFDHIEFGITETEIIDAYNGKEYSITTKYPHDTLKPVMITKAYPIADNDMGWADMEAMFKGWIDSTHFKIRIWNTASGTSKCRFAWMCI